MKTDVIVVGGGIVGLANAWMAARRGKRVVLLERSARAQGASIRNFGMIWPIGQTAGEQYATALRSRELWLELAGEGVLTAEECGSFHVAHREDELPVLEEFCQRGTHQAEMMTPAAVLSRCPAAQPRDLLGGMWSPVELRVDPRAACRRIAAFLAERHAVECHFGTEVVGLNDHCVHAADGRNWQGERVVVCSGSDLRTLVPEQLADAGLYPCKLQMLRTVSQPSPTAGWPHIASGLTLRHYASFVDCPSLAVLRSRVAEETPELDDYGVHVMASFTRSGNVVLGDSHEYGEEITPFDKAEIDELILRELRKVIALRDWRIEQRWHGIYLKNSQSLPFVELQIADGVSTMVGIGGTGMTMAFGLAERAWELGSGS